MILVFFFQIQHNDVNMTQPTKFLVPNMKKPSQLLNELSPWPPGWTVACQTRDSQVWHTRKDLLQDGDIGELEYEVTRKLLEKGKKYPRRWFFSDSMNF